MPSTGAGDMASGTYLSMSAARKKPVEDDVFVNREEICRLFNPPPSESAFHRMVDSGKIKKARDLRGYYLLNATRVHQGMEPVDVRSYRKRREETSAGLKNSQLLFLAVLQCDERFAILSPPSFKLPEALTAEEMAKIEKLRQEHERLADFYEETGERTIYRHGFLDALEAAAHIDLEEH